MIVSHHNSINRVSTGPSNLVQTYIEDWAVPISLKDIMAGFTMTDEVDELVVLHILVEKELFDLLPRHAFNWSEVSGINGNLSWYQPTGVATDSGASGE